MYDMGAAADFNYKMYLYLSLAEINLVYNIHRAHQVREDFKVHRAGLAGVDTLAETGREDRQDQWELKASKVILD